MNEELNQIIFDLIGETNERYGIYQALAATSRGIVGGDFNCFTNQGKEARNRIFKKMDEMCLPYGNGTVNYTFFNGVIDCYIDTVVKSYNLNKFEAKNEKERNLIEVYDYYKEHPCCKDILRQQVIVSNRIDAIALNNLNVMQNCIGGIVSTIAAEYDIEKKLENSRFQVTNQRFHAGNMEKVQEQLNEAIISGLTHAKEGVVNIDNMSASTSIGKKRKNQEDALLIKQHPQNPDFKILVVADGMGGGDSGEVVSNYTVEQLSEWFENLPVAYYKDPDRVAYALNGKLQEISNDMYQKFYGRAGSTFVGGIVCEKETVVANIGDSRAYCYSERGNILTQVSTDDSFVEKLYKIGEIEDRDDMRFHKDSNKILQCIGGADDVKPIMGIVANRSYDKLILLSDGVTDCLSDKDIWTITSRTSRENLAQMLVQSALENTSYARPGLSMETYYSKIDGGKDNTTAVVLDKKSKSKRGEEYDI